MDALLTLLVAPGRIEQADTSQQAELHELAVSGDSGLIAAFAERAGQSLAGELTGSPQLHANCFIMWRLEYGRSGDEVWPATRSSLMNDLLAPAARKMDDTSRQMTFGIIEESDARPGQRMAAVDPASRSDDATALVAVPVPADAVSRAR